LNSIPRIREPLLSWSAYPIDRNLGAFPDLRNPQLVHQTLGEIDVMRGSRPVILLIEDDPPLGNALATELSAAGFQVLWAQTVQQALDFAFKYSTLRFIYLDLGIVNYAPFTELEVGPNGRFAGLRLLEEFQELLPKAKIYVKSASPYPELIDRARSFKSVIAGVKGAGVVDIERKAKAVYSDEGLRPEILVVHGHDTLTLQALQQFIEYQLKLGKPKILRELPDNGRGIMEKFEDYARQADLVFAVMTDDDVSEGNRRARQNVIFEIGYFMGAFGRKSRRLIILKKGDMEIPSDMNGLIFIDITKGFVVADFRRELEGVWEFSD
jgi:hypothetical protein